MDKKKHKIIEPTPEFLAGQDLQSVAEEVNSHPATQNSDVQNDPIAFAESQEAHKSPQPSYQAPHTSQVTTNKGLFSKSMIAPIIILVFVLSIGGYFLFLDVPSEEASTAPQTSSPDEAINSLIEDSVKLRDQLSVEERQIFDSIDLRIYLPRNDSFTEMLLSNNTSSVGPLLSGVYGESPTLSQAHLAITFSQFQKPDTFKPPTKCSNIFPSGLKVSENLACKKYTGETSELYDAYVYDGPTGGVGYCPSTGVCLQPLTIYADFGETVVVITQLGGEANELVSILNTLELKMVSDLPSDVLFYPQ